MYNANYMDGVPVKIAEKYKPPPPIYKLPQSLANKLNLEENYYRNCPVFSYDLQLEQKALSKIEQWKRIRQRNKELRRERISRREQQRKREDEDRQKNLLYSVSYPSTDDLSSGEEEEKVEMDMKCRKNGTGILESKQTAPQICVTETVNSFHNILQPTVLSYNSSSSNSNSTLANSFNYKDFEDDTSSPFDNIELKTINDLDVLAQVLHNTQIKSPADELINESPNNVYPEQKQITQIHTDSLKTAENIPKPNNNLPRFNYDLNSTQGALTELRDHHTISMSAIQYNANLPAPTTSPQHQYNGLTNSNNYYNYQSNHGNQNTNKVDSENPMPYNRLQALMEDQVTKSKSVPDILKELRDEVRNSEIRRYKNCSYNTEESTENIEATTKINDTDTEKEDILSKLDSKAKQLVDQISAMGFPYKRVARIVQLVGTDDKKVIEHLIPLSELVDLGFEESKISDALIRNENNKNKALDDLIS
ncbi:uncharacterized protein LOC135949329 [Calliphora vicina]|uniref:uncharacterized protein LOC135949329 n=1 Tax=Calliphora vicina TaxID=7373 RepID=UPI00325BB0ED